jgi:hypothetical protein
VTPAPGPQAITRDVTAPRDEPGPIVHPGPEADLDPRLDTSAWRVFGRRFPRRWSLYFRILAAVLLVLSLGWWFTRDVTYISNVKVSGLHAATPAYREPLRAVADDFAALVNRLADAGYGWQSGGLPALRAAGALSNSEETQYVAVGTVEVKRRGDGLRASAADKELARFLSTRGWSSTPHAMTLDGAFKDQGPLRATITLSARPEGRERLTLKVVVREVP